MNYNPAITDRSAEIYSNAANNAAQIQFRGMQSLGESLASLGESFSNSISKANENAAKANTNLGTGEAIAAIYKNYGTPQQYKDYLAGLDKNSNNQDRLSGFNAVHVQQANALLDMAKQQNQVNAWANYRSSNPSGTSANTPSAPRMNSENIRSMVAEAKAAGFNDDQIKTKLQSQYGDWAVRSVYPPQNQGGIWMGQ